ncbi:hypothetical protein Cgig2_005639 [Carnegiea gigantea]|uniref:Cation-transporting P-type ATPase N-terminal domain-containing protein n=1 Tax=Carnegiea gigantea TaxID=171969 RepID=A0A9Q1KUG2_9CARY|nr:hypothetical protein Cgig2_005639 [Carnegiea gigantea]
MQEALPPLSPLPVWVANGVQQQITDIGQGEEAEAVSALLSKFMEDAYARSASEVLDFFGVDPTKGLTEAQVADHGRIYGRNGTPFWKLVIKQFDDLLVKILIAAALVSFILALINGETGLTAFLEPSVILMILAANAAVGVITETNAEKAIEELRAYQADVATVLRNGKVRTEVIVHN